MKESNSASTPKPRLVIVDDHLLFRDMFKKVSNSDLNCRVIGEAGTVKRAKAVIEKARPDLVVLDLYLPDGDGFQLAELIRDRWPKVKIIMMSARCDDHTLFQVERANVNGFIDKNAHSIRAVTRRSKRSKAEKTTMRAVITRHCVPAAKTRRILPKFSPGANTRCSS